MQAWELVVRECVRQTLADYTDATDRFDLRALSTCFAAQGTLEFTGGGGVLTGPQEIESGLKAQLGGATRPANGPTHVRHHVSSIRFDAVAPDRAQVVSYFAVFTDVGVDHWGRYRDVLVPHAERWIFASRKIRVDGFAATSLMNPQVV